VGHEKRVLFLFLGVNAIVESMGKRADRQAMRLAGV
jgi:hypothetical protein